MKKFFLALSLCALTFSYTGCSSKTVSTTTTTEEVNPEQKTVKVEKTVETTDDAPYCHGILSCTFEVTGDIIAFPFRLIGGLIDVIF